MDDQPTERKFLYRKGKYIYFRSPITGKLESLPRNEHSPEFEAAYNRCLRAVVKVRVQVEEAKGEPTPPLAVDTSKRIVQHSPGTVGRGLQVYFASTKFLLKTKDSTKPGYRRNGETMRGILGDVLLKDIDVDRVDQYSEQIATKHGLSVGEAHINLLSLVWQSCRKYGEFAIKGLVNPTDDAERHYKAPKAPWRPWKEDEQQKFMMTAPDNLKLAKMLQHFLGQRGGDGIRIKWTEFDGKGIWVTPQKTDANPDPMPNYHKCPAPLLAALLQAPRLADTILVNQWGKPWAETNSLSKAIRRELKRLKIWKKGARNPVLHGLRKNFASDLAETGATGPQIKASGGWKTDRVPSYYAQHADKVRMNEAAVDRWDEALAKQPKLRVVK